MSGLFEGRNFTLGSGYATVPFRGLVGKDFFRLQLVQLGGCLDRRTYCRCGTSDILIITTLYINVVVVFVVSPIIFNAVRNFSHV